MTVRVYEYGCLDPTEGRERIDEQISRAHRYQHTLVEIERRRRARVREVMSAHGDVEPLVARTDALAAELTTVREAIKSASRAARTRIRDEVAEARARELREQLRAARADLKVAKQRIREDTDVTARIKAIDEDGNAAIRAARAVCGVYWGTYLVVEDGLRRARRGKMDPQFRRWDGSGHLAVQLQGGLATEEVFSTDTRLQLAPVPTEAWTHPSRGERRRLCRSQVHFRIGSDESGAPVWAVLPVMLHRPLPEGGRIKWAHLIRRPLAHDFEWRLQIVVETPDVTRKPAGDGTVAIDVGWRLRQDGVRVGYWYDGEQSGEFLLPASIIDRLAHADSLRSIRDQAFNVIRAEFAEWLAQNEHHEWLTERTHHLSQWRSCGRLAGVVLAWRSQRFAGDTEIYKQVESWRKQDKHLWTWETHERDRALGHRRDVYRQWAAGLTSRYAMIVLEEFDLRRVTKRDAPEDQQSENETARLQRQRAGVSILRQAIVSAATARGATIAILDATNTTRRCHACGHTEAFPAAEYVMHACGGCGLVWDQDDNAARNLYLASTEVPPTAPGLLAGGQSEVSSADAA